MALSSQLTAHGSSHQYVSPSWGGAKLSQTAGPLLAPTRPDDRQIKLMSMAYFIKTPVTLWDGAG